MCWVTERGWKTPARWQPLQVWCQEFACSASESSTSRVVQCHAPRGHYLTERSNTRYSTPSRHCHRRGAQVHGAHQAASHIPALKLPSRSRYSFTDPERMEGWVSPGPAPGCKEQLAHGCYAKARSQRDSNPRGPRPRGRWSSTLTTRQLYHPLFALHACRANLHIFKTHRPTCLMRCVGMKTQQLRSSVRPRNAHFISFLLARCDVSSDAAARQVWAVLLPPLLGNLTIKINNN